MGGELDATEEATFAAVGLALTRWEGVEISLADLYSVFRGAPFDRRTVTAFGRGRATTTARLAGLEKAAPEFFFHYPNQAREHAFEDALRQVRALSLDRHRIAHGLVDRVTFMLADGGYMTGFALVAPWYGQSRLKLSNNDAWGASTINTVSDHFVALAREIMAFTRAG